MHVTYRPLIHVLRNTYVYTHTYMYIIVISEKRGQEFEREQVGVYKRIWREEKEWINDVIIISKKSEILLKYQVYEMELTFPIRGRKGEPRITFQWRHVGNFISFLCISIQLM